MRGISRVVPVALTVSALLVGCGRKEEPVKLILYCGAGIRPAAEALISAFEKRTGVRVSATYAGSGRLLAQLTAARRGDLYMPGAAFYVDAAVEKGLADAATQRIAMYFVPVVFVQKGNPKGIASLRDFKRAGLRLYLGDERACAVGRKTLVLLEKHGIAWSEIEENVVNRSATVNELALAVQLGTVDAVIVWDANARQFARDGDIVPIPPETNSISTVPIVMLRFTESPAEAKAFIEFVTSDEGRRIIREAGYTVGLSGADEGGTRRPAGGGWTGARCARRSVTPEKSLPPCGWLRRAAWRDRCAKRNGI